MLKHFIYSSSSKSATSPLCSLYYRYSSEVSSSFCILSFLVIAISIDQTFYSATHYLAAVWLDSRHDLNTLSAFTLLIVCLISSFEMRKSDDIVKSINESAMSLMFIWESERKNFSRNISIFSSNVVVIWSVLLRFSDKNWESFLNSWLSILTHFAKRHIDLSASLSSCICDLKCAHFACWMILFLW